MNKKSFIYPIFLILLVFTVIAQGDFTVTAESKVDLCPCSNQGYPIYIENKGSSTTTYSVSFSGSAAGWAKAAPEKFSINPGTTSYFFVYINSDCNIQGSYDLNTHIQTSSITKTLKQSLNFIECYKSYIELGKFIEMKEGQTTAKFSEQNGTYNICEEDKKILPILITNEESYGNSYILSLTGLDWAKLNISEVALDGNKKGIVLVELSPGKGSSGEYKLNFNTITKLGNAKKNKEIDIKVDKCYGLNINIEEEEDLVCEETSYDVKIENDGTLSETINLSTNFDWAEIDNTLILGGNKETISKLTLNPKSISGVYNVEVKGSVLNHDIEASDKIKVNIVPKEECYKAEIDLKKKITNHYTEEYYNIDVVNKGLKEASYDIVLEGPSWASIDPDFVELNPGQKGNVNLYINPNENIEEGDYKATLKVEFDNITYSEEIDITLKQENKVIKAIKNFLKYFQYYIYLGFAVLILILIFIKPIKSQIAKTKSNYQKYKLKKEKQRQKEEERSKREEVKRKLKEEMKAKKEEEKKKIEEEKKRKKELEEKKAKQQKKAEKLAGKKKRKFPKKYLIWFIILAIIAVLVFLGFILLRKIDFDFIQYLGVGLEGVGTYSYYILIALVFLVLIILFFRTLEKEDKKKAKESKKIKEEKKAEKKKRKRFSKFIKSTYFKISLVILILLIIFFVIYYFFSSYLMEFFVLYSYYFIIGIIILILAILIMKFYKPVAKFFSK